ncbi:MAG: Ig-like domain-containing protein [Bacteroidaceae bacterium]|nr:Ig-like domain-containing protein [Bacteroidaceae bacterium]
MPATPSFTWTSSDESVATVAADGTVTGVARGTAIITATDANSNWVASYELTVEPAVVAADNVEVWDGTSDAILGSIRIGGDQYKPAYTMTFDSGMDYNDAHFNEIFGVPEKDESGKAWYEADFTMTNVPGAVWSYNNTVLPNSWPGNMGEVYVRRYFKTQGELPTQLYMPAAHDDAPCEYYINGTLVWSRTGTEPGVNGWYEDEIVKLNDEQRALIKTDGSVNVFAYHVHQNWGGRYADGGIYGNSMAENSPSARFENNENRIRLVSAVKHAESVEGFPADLLANAKEANVCLQDAGYYLGLIRWELRKMLSPRHNYEMASAEPADNLECWLYNVGAGQFLAGSNDWGTHASLDYNISAWPMILRANSSGENRFAIQTNLPNGVRGGNDGLGHNGYVDCGYGDDFTTNEGWAWTFEAIGDGNYRIIQSDTDRYLGMTEDERYQVDTDKTGADNPYNHWKVITREQFEALAAAATPENPADVSYYIHQNTFSQNDFDGNDKGAANADLNDSKWERNAGSIWNWKGNDANGDYVYEMWNTAGTGKVYLKQTIEGLPAGQYIVECTGYYRDGTWEDAIAGNARKLAYLYAGSEENSVELPNILEGANQGAGYGRLHSETMIADGCAQAPRFFKLGAYTVQAPVVTVGNDGKLEIGVYRDAEDVKEKDWIVLDNFRLYRIGQAITIGEALYATYVAPADVDFSGSKVSAFAAQTKESYVHLEPVTTVPAGTAVVVKADAAGTYAINGTTRASLGTENELVAATADVTADGTQYILSKEDEGVGFYKAKTGSTINAGKGYLVIRGAGVKGFYGFDEDATGINAVEIANENAPVYNVAGQRLQKMQKGINIVGGKKVLK